MRDHCSLAVFPVLPKRSFFAAFLASAVRRLPCTPQKPPRPVLPWLTRSDSHSGYIFFPFARGLCHARLRHFFLDAGACRFAGFNHGFLLHRTFMMASKSKQFSSIQDVPGNSRHMPPQFTRALSSCAPAKLKAQAQPRQLARTRTAWIALSLETDQAHRTRLHNLNMIRALKGVQLQTSAPKLDERQARLCEKKSPKMFQLREAFQAVVTLVSSRKLKTETRRGFSGVQVHHRGSGQQRRRDRSEYGYALRNMFLRYDDPWY
jgi:hypothetical protein